MDGCRHLRQRPAEPPAQPHDLARLLFYLVGLPATAAIIWLAGESIGAIIRSPSVYDTQALVARLALADGHSHCAPRRWRPAG